MLSREKQTDWFVKLIIEEIKLMPPQQATDVIILGTAFKANTNLTTGSPSLLLNSLLCEAGVRSTLVDPVVDTSIGELKFTSQALFFIGTKHDVFATVKFPRGSVVIDPHRYIADQDGVKVIRLGEGTK
jgi:UDP-N-acetyl-D-mannosaminuronate dehydrogenase